MYDQTPRNSALSKSLPDTRSPKGGNGTPARLLNPFDDGLLLLARPGSSPATAGLRSNLHSPSDFHHPPHISGSLSRRSQTAFRNAVTSMDTGPKASSRRFGSATFWADSVETKPAVPSTKHRLLNLLLYDHHPVKILLYFRLLIFLPLTLTLLLALMKGSDWRHNVYSFGNDSLRLATGLGQKVNKTRSNVIKLPPVDAQYVVTYDQVKPNMTESLAELTPVASRTLLSLTTIERYIESVDQSGNGSSTIHELPLSYASLLNPRRSEFCRSTNNTELITEKLQQVKPVERLRRDRSVKLALYDALYGPIFRDVDCRALRTFRKAGLLLSVAIFFTMMLLTMEWLIALCHAVSKSFREGSVLAYTYVTNKPAQPSTEASKPPFRREAESTTRQPTDASDPAFVIPSDEWIQIEMPSQGNDAEMCPPPRRSLDVSDGSSTPYSGRCPRAVHRRCQGHTGRIVVLGEHRLNIWADHLWWRPLGAVLSCLNIQLQRGDRRKYACVSLLEGPPTLFALVALLLYSYALWSWKASTGDPACLNKYAELRTCPPGRCYWLALAVWWLLGLNLALHVFSVELCSRAEERFRANSEAADTCHVEKAV